MSKPITPAQTLAQLKKWRVPHVVVPGWETRNRAGHGPFDNVNGFVVHHTGDDAPDNVDLSVIINGRSGLPGPLAQFGCDDVGMIYVVGNGRANHAGGGDPRVLDAVRAESYGDFPPVTHEHTGSSGAVDGNSHFYGVETFYSGNKEPTSKARASLVLLAAALCDFHGWSAKSVIGHKEWSDFKSDPGHVDMKLFRADVAATLRKGPTTVSTTTQKPTRVSRARALLKDAIELLDAAVKDGREGVVKDVRDELRKQRKRLPLR
jgi:hypothetical protein